MNLEQRLDVQMENPNTIKSAIGVYNLGIRLKQNVFRVMIERIERIEFDEFTDKQCEKIKAIVLRALCRQRHRPRGSMKALSINDQDLRIKDDEMAALHCRIEKTYLTRLDNWKYQQGFKTRTDALRALILLADR